MKEEDKVKWLWDYLKHSENTFTNRINFFLVAESMLMVSYATIANNYQLRNRTIGLVIILLGVLFTVAWFYVNLRAAINMTDIVGRIRKAIPLYQDIWSKRWHIKRLSARHVLAYFMPCILFLAWVSLLLFQLISK
jgi:hypothetical protein